jgi:heme A synthase
MTVWPFRLTMTFAATLLFDQAIFAGRMLSGSFPALHTHRENATWAGLAVLLAALGAIPLRWPGHGPLWPALAAVGLFALVALQILLGFRRALIVHVPLGVTIIALGALLTIWAWRYQPPPPPRAADRAPDRAPERVADAGRSVGE